MSYLTVEGSKFLFSTTFGNPVVVNSISNADPAVAITQAAHTFSANDELLFMSGWEDANETIFKAGVPGNATSVPLTLLETTDDQWYPAGTGGGTLSKISNWVEIGQVLDVASNGGGSQKMDIKPLSKRNGISVPIGFESSSIELTIGYDPKLPAQIQLNKVSRNLKQKVAFKFLLSGGETGYGYGYAQLSRMPGMKKGSPLDLKLSISFLGQLMGYPS